MAIIVGKRGAVPTSAVPPVIPMQEAPPPPPPVLQEAQQLTLGANGKPDLASLQMANTQTNSTPPPQSELINPTNLAKYQSPAAEGIDPNLASAYQEKMNYLAELLQQTDDKHSITDAVENCLLYVQENVQLKPIITAENIQLIVRAARKGAAGIIAKKRVTKAKKTKRESKVSEFDDALSEIGF